MDLYGKKSGRSGGVGGVGRDGVVVEDADRFIGWAIVNKEFRPFGTGGDGHDVVVYENAVRVRGGRGFIQEQGEGEADARGCG